MHGFDNEPLVTPGGTVQIATEAEVVGVDSDEDGRPLYRVELNGQEVTVSDADLAD